MWSGTRRRGCFVGWESSGRRGCAQQGQGLEAVHWSNIGAPRHSSSLTTPYTHQMKPAPAIPKTLEAKVARVARQLRKAPRLVLKEAIDEYVARHDPEAVTEAMNRVAELVDTRPDPGVAGAARRTLERTEW